MTSLIFLFLIYLTCYLPLVLSFTGIFLQIIFFFFLCLLNHFYTLKEFKHLDLQIERSQLLQYTIKTFSFNKTLSSFGFSAVHCPTLVLVCCFFVLFFFCFILALVFTSIICPFNHLSIHSRKAAFYCILMDTNWSHLTVFTVLFQTWHSKNR